MRVVVDGRVFCEPYPSGVTISSQLYLQKLINDTADVEWTISTRGNSKPANDLFDQTLKEVHKNIPNRVTNFLISSNLHSSRNFFPKSDLVWLPNPMFIPRPVINTVVTIHDLSLKYWPNFFSKHTRFWYNRWVLNFLKQRHKNVWLAAVSERTKQDIELIYPHWKGRVTYTPSVPPSPTKFDESWQFELDNLGIRTPYIFVVSTIEPRKNILSIIAAFKKIHTKFPDLSLIIAGQDRINLRKIEQDGVKILGYLNNAQKQALYASASVVVYPSYYEGYGYPPLEAIAAGVPVVISAAGSLPETIGNGAIYTNPYTAHIELIDIIEALMVSTDLRSKLVQQGKERLQYLHSNFSTKPMLDLWKSLV